jgi:hypothetical protein
MTLKTKNLIANIIGTFIVCLFASPMVWLLFQLHYRNPAIEALTTQKCISVGGHFERPPNDNQSICLTHNHIINVEPSETEIKNWMKEHHQ